MKPIFRGKSKWLVAFALCMSCLLICASIMAAPTLAAPSSVRDAYYNYLTDTLKIAQSSTGSAVTLSSLTAGAASVLLQDLDGNGVEEMLVVTIGAASSGSYPVKLSVYEYDSSKTEKVALADFVLLGSLTSAESLSVDVFKKGSQIGVETRETVSTDGTETIPATKVTNYSLSLYTFKNSALTADKQITGKLSTEAQTGGTYKNVGESLKSGTTNLFTYTLSGGVASDNQADTLNAAYNTATGFTGNNWKLSNGATVNGYTYSSLWDFSTSNLRGIAVREPAAGFSDLFTLSHAANATTLTVTDSTDWLNVKKEDTSTTAASTTSVVALINLTLSDKSNWSGPGTYTVGTTSYTNAYLAGIDENTSGTIASTIVTLGKKYSRFTGTLAADAANSADANIVVKFYADGSSTPFYTSTAVTKAGTPVNFDVSVGGYSSVKIVVENTAAKGPAKVILGNAKFSVTGTETTTTTVAADKYVLVSGYASLYEVRNADNSSKTPKAYVWGYDAATGKSIFNAAEHDGTYYVQMMDTGIYVAIKGGTVDSFDLTNTIWYGDDKIFGTSDDVEASLRSNNKFYYEVLENGQKVWREICDLVTNWPDCLFPGYTEPTTTAAITTETVTTTAADATTTTSPLFDATNSSGIPQTGGFSLSAGVIFALAILFVSCCYCAYRYFKRDDELAA